MREAAAAGEDNGAAGQGGQAPYAYCPPYAFSKNISQISFLPTRQRDHQPSPDPRFPSVYNFLALRGQLPNLLGKDFSIKKKFLSSFLAIFFIDHSLCLPLLTDEGGARRRGQQQADEEMEPFIRFHAITNTYFKGCFPFRLQFSVL